jgi:hypothetical protein
MSKFTRSVLTMQTVYKNSRFKNTIMNEFSHICNNGKYLEPNELNTKKHNEIKYTLNKLAYYTYH